MDTILKIFFRTTDSTLFQFLRYLIVGGLAAFIDIIVFFFCVTFISPNIYLSKTISFIFSLLVNFLLSRSWVFSKGSNNFKRDFLVFSLVGLIGLVLSYLILFILLQKGFLVFIFPTTLNETTIKSIANVIAISIVIFWNFNARKKFVFK